MNTRSRRPRGTMLAIAAGAAGCALTMTSVPAYAQSNYQGRTTAGINIRSAPSVHTGVKGSIGAGRTIQIDCKVTGTNIDGNRNWYALANNQGWVSARYVQNIGRAPSRCPEFDTENGVGRTTEGVNFRAGPTTRDARTGSAGRGRELIAVCYVASEQVLGDSTWYLLDNGSWVSGRFVERRPAIPSNWVPCAE